MTRHQNGVVGCVSLACWTILSLAVADTALAQEDADKVIASGRVLFTHQWTANDPFSPGGDGLGPAYNEVSCVACHSQGGIGGAGGNEKNVDVLTVGALRPRSVPIDTLDTLLRSAAAIHPLLNGGSNTVLHRFNTNTDYFVWRNTRIGMQHLKSEDVLIVPRNRDQTPMAQTTSVAPSNPARIPFRIFQRNTPALFGAALIDSITDNDIREEAIFQRNNNLGVEGCVPVANGNPSSDPESQVGPSIMSRGKVGRFGWRGQTATLRDFVLTACSNELGLEIPGTPQASDPLRVKYEAPGIDLTLEQCDQIVAFIASLPRPLQILPDDEELTNEVRLGERVFDRVLCGNCHAKKLGDVDGLYSDLLLHDMGPGLADPVPSNPAKSTSIARAGPPSPSTPSQTPRRSYTGGSSDLFSEVPARLQQEWRTPPLWGVRDSAPYLHDGRAATLEEAVALHGGEAALSLRAYQALPRDDKERLYKFLNTLAAPQTAQVIQIR